MFKNKNKGNAQAINTSHHGWHKINSCSITSAYEIFRIEISVKYSIIDVWQMYGTSSTTDVWDRGEKNTAFIPCMQAEHEWIWGVNRMCALCNCDSVQRRSGDDTNSILPEKSMFNITFSSLLGNSRFSPPLGFFFVFLKTETLATPKSERLYQHVQRLPLDTWGIQ